MVLGNIEKVQNLLKTMDVNGIDFEDKFDTAIIEAIIAGML